jgi:hypothetical protein
MHIGSQQLLAIRCAGATLQSAARNPENRQTSMSGI